jgi:UDP:flavonoid glycosyltransferase YjiC (YdhE family)
MASQILLNPIGSGGDVFPFLALGCELQKRGHHVAVMTNPIFKENIGQAGLECIEIGSEAALRAVGQDSRLHRAGNAWKLALKWGAVGTLRQTFDVIGKRIEKCDTMLVAPCIAFGSRLAAEKFRLPLASVVLSPFVVRSVFQSPVIGPMWLDDWVPKGFKRLQFWVADRCVIDPVVKSDISSLRKELGLPLNSRFLHRWCFSDDLTLALFPEFFAPPQPDWPPSLYHTGPVSWDPPSDIQATRGLDRFVDPNRKPIVVLAGSAGPESPTFYQNWMDAANKLGRQLILLERNQSLVPKPLPKHVFHASYFPIDQVLDRSAVIGHGGGVGTTLRSLAAGVPQIVCPKVNDQPDNARRVQRLGVGTVITTPNPGVDEIIDALHRTLNNRTIAANCKTCQARFPEAKPVEKCCDLIEATFDRYRT